MAQESQDIVIPSMRGGYDDGPPTSLQPDQATLADNVEFFYSTFGERRAGCEPLSMTGAGFGAMTDIVHLSQWFPTNDIQNPELWAIAAVPGVAGIVPLIARRSGTVTGNPTWNPVSAGLDPIINSIPNVYQVVSRSLNGKLFWAYDCGFDRGHVWDGSAWRLSGLAAPDVPTVTNEGSGAYSGTRYFRTRLVSQKGDGSLTRRSEPSESVTFEPSGSGAGARIARALVTSAPNSHSDEGQTAWEVEAAEDNATFYRIATVPIATLTYDDDTASALDYATNGVLSDAVGAYELPPSARFLATDGDRLLMAGNYADKTKESNISWSPVSNDPGVGNDERVPLVTTGGASVNNTMTLDNYDGGPLTGISDAVFGTWYAFKYSRIYKLFRTQDNVRAYESITMSTTRGAILGSIFPGVDENGQACVYFLDPLFGPSRVGPGGLELIQGLRETWKRVNLKAERVVARGIYYPYKQQAHWWVALDGANTPSIKFISQTSEMRRDATGGLIGCWSTASGTIAGATAVSLYWEWVNENGNVTLSLRPFVGLAGPDFVQRCDANTTDAGDAYFADMITRPFISGGLLTQWGAMVGALLATSCLTQDINVSLIRDFGKQASTPITVDLAPVGAEEFVIRVIDNLRMSEAYAIQVRITDVP